MTRRELYHERQSKQLCALHALNNLVQTPNAFTQKDLDAICSSLAPNNRFLNPHKSSLGLGNYDVNVVMKALQTKGLEAVWFDKRKNPDCLETSQIVGFILNIPNPNYSSKWGANFFNPLNYIVSRKHWVAVVQDKVDGNYYNLDSKLDSPEQIGSARDLFSYLQTHLETTDCELFVVIKKEVAETGIWSRA